MRRGAQTGPRVRPRARTKEDVMRLVAALLFGAVIPALVVSARSQSMSQSTNQAIDWPRVDEAIGRKAAVASGDAQRYDFPRTYLPESRSDARRRMPPRLFCRWPRRPLANQSLGSYFGSCFGCGPIRPTPGSQHQTTAQQQDASRPPSFGLAVLLAALSAPLTAFRTDRSIRSLLSATLHATLVLRLAGRPRIVGITETSLVAALLATVRLRSRAFGHGPARHGRHDNDCHDPHFLLSRSASNQHASALAGGFAVPVSLSQLRA